MKTGTPPSNFLGNKTSDPASAQAGQQYYNTSTHKLRVYNGTTWADSDLDVSAVWGGISGSIGNQTDLAAQSTADRARATHTGTQTASTISDFNSAALSAAPAETATTLGATLAAAASATPNDLDLVSTADTSVLKKITWGNVKVFLKAYFDTLYNKTESIIIAASDETTAITATGTKVTFRMPYAFTLTGIRASLSIAASSGTFTVDVNESGTTIMSVNKLKFDATEKTTTTYSGTAAAISDASLANDAEITVDVDDVGGSNATGLKVTLIGYQT